MKHQALILKGNKGVKIFREIYNAPKVPYEKLLEESEKIKKKWKTEENERNIGTHQETNNVRGVEKLCRLKD